MYASDTYFMLEVRKGLEIPRRIINNLVGLGTLQGYTHLKGLEMGENKKYLRNVKKYHSNQ